MEECIFIKINTLSRVFQIGGGGTRNFARGCINSKLYFSKVFMYKCFFQQFLAPAHGF